MNEHWTTTVDDFIGTVLLPSTDRKQAMTATQIYQLFEQYCEQLNKAAPVSVIGLSKHIRTRFSSHKTNGTSRYHCSVRPELLVEEDDG